jgi:hypothetical protein
MAREREKGKEKCARPRDRKGEEREEMRAIWTEKRCRRQRWKKEIESRGTSEKCWRGQTQI